MYDPGRITGLAEQEMCAEGNGRKHSKTGEVDRTEG